MALIDKDGRAVVFDGAAMVYSVDPTPAPDFTPTAEWPEDGGPRIANLPPNGILFYAGRIYDVSAEGHVVWSGEWPDEITVRSGVDPTGLLTREVTLTKPTGPADGPDWSQALQEADVEIVGLVEDPHHPGMVTAVLEVVNDDHPAADAIALYWMDRAELPAIGYPMQDLGTDYTVPASGSQEAVPPSGRRRWRLRSPYLDTNIWHVREPGASGPQIALKYQLTGPESLPEGNNTYPQTPFLTTPHPDVPPMTAEFQSEWTSPWSSNRWTFHVPLDFFGEVEDPDPDPDSEYPEIADLWPELGFWHDISDASTVFSDTAGTTPATVNGAVRLVKDKSGNGHDIVFAAPGATLRESDGKRYLEIGAARGTIPSAAGMLRALEYFTIYSVSGAAPENDADNSPLFCWSRPDNTQVWIDLRYVDGTPRVGGRHPIQTGVYEGTLYGPAHRSDAVLTAVYDFSGGKHSIAVDGGTPVSGNFSNNGQADNFGDSQIVTFGGSASNAAKVFQGRYYGGIAIARALTQDEHNGVLVELAALRGGDPIDPGEPDPGEPDPGDPGEPGEPLPAGTILPLSTANAAEAAKGNNIVGRDGVGHDTNDPFNAHRVAALAWHAAAGVQTHDAKLLAHLKSLAGGGSPSLKLESGYGAQQATGPLAAIAMSRYIPRIWNALTSTERNKLALLVESALYAAAFTVGENSPYANSGGKNEMSLRGDTNTGRDWNPNYRFGQSSHIGIAAAFFAADGDPSQILKQKCDSFNFNNHLSALQNSGLSNTYKTWNRSNWSGAPTASEIQSVIRGFRRYGVTMAGWWDIIISDANRTFNRTSNTGLNGGQGIGGFGKIAQGASGLPTLGQMGMATELDASDGGGPRSSLDYAWGGAIIAFPTWAALIVAGLVNRNRSDVIAHWNRMRVGREDILYKWQQGYLNYSNGRGRGHWRMDAPAGSNYHGNPDTWGHWHGMDLWQKVVAYVLGDESGGGGEPGPGEPDPDPDPGQMVQDDKWSVGPSPSGYPNGSIFASLAADVVPPAGHRYGVWQSTLTTGPTARSHIRDISPGETWYTDTFLLPANATVYAELHLVNEATNNFQLVSNRKSYVMPDYDEEPGDPGGGDPGDPPPGDAPANVTVSSVSQLRSAILSQPGGAVIAMAPGDYPDALEFLQGGVNKNPPIRIRPQDRSNPPRFTSKAIDFRNVEGLIFDGIRFEGMDRDAQGYPARYGITMHYCKRITFVNCTVIFYHAQFATSFCEDMTFEWNSFTRSGMDYFRVYETQKNWTWRHNYFGNHFIDASRAHQSGRHPDIIQLATNSVNNGQGMDGLLVEYNVMYGGPVQQGVFMHNERAAGGNFNYVHRNLVVRHNYIEGRHIHGIQLGGTRDFLIEGNLIRRSPQAGTGQIDTPSITFQTGYNRNGIVRNNVTAAPIGQPSWTGDRTNVTFTGNVSSPTAVPSGWSMPVVGPYNQP